MIQTRVPKSNQQQEKQQRKYNGTEDLRRNLDKMKNNSFSPKCFRWKQQRSASNHELNARIVAWCDTTKSIVRENKHQKSAGKLQSVLNLNINQNKEMDASYFIDCSINGFIFRRYVDLGSNATLVRDSAMS